MAWAVLGGLAGCGDEASTPTVEERLADGRHFGYIRSVDLAATPPTIAFDVAEFLVGDEANAAAEAAGLIEPGGTVPND